MADIKEGDVVLSYVKGSIVSIAIATSESVLASKPNEKNQLYSHL